MTAARPQGEHHIAHFCALSGVSRAGYYRHWLARAPLHTASMSRVGNPYDNARAESFMKTLKQEEVDGSAYRNLAAVRTSITAFIEDVYNRDRLHSALGYLTPVEFEAEILPPEAAVRRTLAASATNCPP